MSENQTTVTKKIDRTMTIADILSMFPHKAQRLSKEITNAGLHCVGCQAATWETLEGGMLGHGMTNDDIERLVKRLNALLDEPVDMSTVTMTKRAAAKYKEILAEEGKMGWGLRFSERMGGCSGFEYSLDYSEKALPDDVVVASNDVEIHVNKGHWPNLVGSEIDFIEGLHESGFSVSSPKAKSSCACGSSHGH